MAQLQRHLFTFHSSLFHIRVPTRSQFDTYRGAVQLECLAKCVRKVAFVAPRQSIDLTAVHHDDRRIASALMSVTQSNPPAAYEWRLVGQNRVLQHTGQPWCCHVRECGAVTRINRIDNVVNVVDSVSIGLPAPSISSHQPGLRSAVDEAACAEGDRPVNNNTALLRSGANSPQVS